MRRQFSLALASALAWSLCGAAQGAPTYGLQLFNVDDRLTATLTNDDLANFVIASQGYSAAGPILDITGYVNPGNNHIDLSLQNDLGGYTYGYNLWRNDQLIHTGQCGTVGVLGCDNNSQQLGEVFTAAIDFVGDPFRAVFDGSAVTIAASPGALGWGMEADFQPISVATLAEAAALGETIGESFVGFNWLQRMTGLGWVDERGRFHDDAAMALEHFRFVPPHIDPALGGNPGEPGGGDQYPWYLDLSANFNPTLNVENPRIYAENYMLFIDYPRFGSDFFATHNMWRMIFTTELVAYRADGTGVIISDLYPDLNTGFTWQYTQDAGDCPGCSNVSYRNGDPTLSGKGVAEFLGYGSIQPAPVPEPSTWAMLCLGFGIVGSAVRRSRRARRNLGQSSTRMAPRR